MGQDSSNDMDYNMLTTEQKGLRTTASLRLASRKLQEAAATLPSGPLRPALLGVTAADERGTAAGAGPAEGAAAPCCPLLPASWPGLPSEPGAGPLITPLEVCFSGAS